MGLTNNIKKQQARICDLDELFHSYGYFYVPNYQRSYDWKKVNIEDFIDSLDEIFQEKIKNNNSIKSQFFGTIMLASRENNIYDIIDGQQRITTFFILLKVIADLIKWYVDEMKNSGVNNNDERFELAQSEISKIHSLIFVKEKKLGIEQYKTALKTNKKLIIEHASPDFTKSMNDFFNNSVVIKNSESYKKIKKNYNLIKNSINDLIQKLSQDYPKYNSLELILYFKDVIFDDIYFLVLQLEDTENAFAIFDSMNSTGLPLNPFDLVNGSIISKLKKNETLKKVWTNKINFLKENGANLGDYIFYWLNSFDEEVPKVSIYKKVDSLIESDTVEKVADNILRNFDYLQELLISQKNTYISQYIKLLNRKKIIPVYLSLKNKGYDPEKIEDILLKLIKYSIIEYSFYGANPGSFQYKIRSIISKINNSQTNEIDFDKIKTISKIDEDFIKYSKRGTQMKEKLLSGEIDDDQLMKCLFYMIIQEQQSEVKDPGFEKIEIEHTLPQKPDSDWFKDKKWFDLKKKGNIKTFINMIGNMILLKDKINKAIQNKPVKEKEKQMEDKLFKLRDEDIMNSKWNKIDYNNFSPEYIISRTEEIINLILRLKIFDI